MTAEITDLIKSICEAGMLICFGISWPINFYKSVKTKSTKGKSLVFLILIDLGYVIGIFGKIVSDQVFCDKWWVFAVYIFNFVFVTADFIMYFINKRREKKNIQ